MELKYETIYKLQTAISNLQKGRRKLNETLFLFCLGFIIAMIMEAYKK